MKIRTFLLLMTPFISFSAFASEHIETDREPQLLESCQALVITPEQMTAKYCIYFIKGFIAATQDIYTSTHKKQRKNKDVSYGFLRSPPRNFDQTPPLRLMPFCLPEDESEARIIKRVSKQLSSDINTLKMLRDRIFKTLQAEYACG